MSDFDLYLAMANLAPYDSKNPNKCHWMYIVPQELMERFSRYSHWTLICDYIATTSNFSNVDNCKISFFNDVTKRKYSFTIPPSIKITPVEIHTVIQAVFGSSKVQEVTEATGKIWSLGYADDKFSIGKSTSKPPLQYVDHLYIFIGGRLGEKLGFSRDQLVMTGAMTVLIPI